MATTQETFYIVGGTLQRDAQSYVRRQADDRLADALHQGKFCYVLTSRQMGKSSLMVRAATQLRAEGARVAVLDLTALGQNLTPDQWYDGMLARIGQQLDLEDELEDFWLENSTLGYLQRWMRAVSDIVLKYCKGRVVIFIDEIDAVRSLPFSTDEFFAGIREFYNRRTEDAELNRLTFCLLGVATPSDLIRDTRTTPFNIGQRIELTDFTMSEARALAPGLRHAGKSGEKLLQQVIYWTGGHPYLTQRLCQAVAGDAAIRDPTGVDRLCDELFLSSGARERDDNLLFVRERLLRSEADLASLLDLYSRVRKGNAVPDDTTNPLVSILKLAGVTRVENGSLKLRNRIYERVFNREWITLSMPGAELRRQRAAYRKGLWRAALVAAVMLALAAVALATLAQRNRTEKAMAKLAVEKRQESDELAESLRQALEDSKREKARADDNAARADAAAQVAQTRAEEARAALRRVEVARAEAETAKADAEAKRKEAEQQRDYRTGLLYASEMRSAQQAFDNGEVPLFRDIMNRQIPEPGDKDLRGIEWHYLNHSSTKVINEAAPVKAVAFSLDGSTLASGGEGFLRLRNTRTGEQQSLPLARPTTVNSLAFSADGKLLAVGGASKSITVWDIGAGRESAVLQGHNVAVTSVALSPTGKFLASGSSDNTIKVYDLNTRKLRFSLDRHTNTVNAVAFSPDGKVLVSASSDNTIKIWEVETGKEIQTLAGYDYSVYAIAFSPDGRWLASGGADTKVRLWETSTWKEAMIRFDGDGSTVNSITFSPDGKRLISGSVGNNISFWDVSTGQLLLSRKAHQKGVSVVAVSPDSRQIAIASTDKTLKLIDLHRLDEKILEEPGLPDSREDKRSAYVNSWRWGYGVNGVAFSPDGRQVAAVNVGSPGGVARLWDAESGKQVLTLTGHGGSVSAVAFSPDGAWMATCSTDKTAKLWDAHSGKLLRTFSGHEAKVSSLTFSADGRLLATAGGDHTVKIWEPETGKMIRSLQGNASFKSVTFSPDGRRLAAGDANGTITVWEVESGTEMLSIPAHEKGVETLEFSPDGSHLVSGSADYTIKVWDARTSGAVLSLKGHQGTVHRALYSRDGTWILSAAEDGTVRVWDARDGQEVLLLRGHAAPIQWCALSKDGRWLAAACRDGRVKIWDFARLLLFSQR